MRFVIGRDRDAVVGGFKLSNFSVQMTGAQAIGFKASRLIMKREDAGVAFEGRHAAFALVGALVGKEVGKEAAGKGRWLSASVDASPGNVMPTCAATNFR